MQAILMSCNNCNEEYAFEIVQEYIKPYMKVAFVPFASDLHWQLQEDFTEYKKRHFKVFSDFGIPEENMFIVKLSYSRDEILDLIHSVDIVFFSGGYMENAMFLIKYFNLGGFFKFIKNHKLFMGESAGTLILQNEYIEVPYIEDAYKEYKKKEGLGLMGYFNIIVHYDKHNEKHKQNKKFIEDSSLKLTVGLTDQSLIIVDGKVTRLIGDYEL